MDGRIKIVFILGIAFAAYKVSRASAYENVRAVIDVAKANHPIVSDIPSGLVLGLILQESGGNPNATGAAGEYGLMQIMPGTWDYVTGKYGLNYAGLQYESYQNVVVGMYYLVDVRNDIDGFSWIDAIQAYNLGASGFKQGRRNWPYFFGVIKKWIMA
uniref:Putative transglycosylase n=1 Tax=viral metagenome TaxID=1070528 RepID=A0A6M3JQV6_9ZZZZ